MKNTICLILVVIGFNSSTAYAQDRKAAFNQAAAMNRAGAMQAEMQMNRLRREMNNPGTNARRRNEIRDQMKKYEKQKASYQQGEAMSMLGAALVGAALGAAMMAPLAASAGGKTGPAIAAPPSTSYEHVNRAASDAAQRAADSVKRNLEGRLDSLSRLIKAK